MTAVQPMVASSELPFAHRIYAIPFKNHPEDSFVGATIPELFDRVLIGPSPDAYAIAQAFVAELRGFGLEQAEDKVVVTSIPLRT